MYLVNATISINIQTVNQCLVLNEWQTCVHNWVLKT